MTPAALAKTGELAEALVRVDRVPLARLARGIYEGVPEEDYHDTSGPVVVSNSLLGRVLRSPAHARAWLDGAADDDSPVLSFGRSFHRALLEPHRSAPAATTKKAREDADTIALMTARVHADPLAARILASGRAELTLRWRDAETGLECKARLDWLMRDLPVALDAKSTTDASPDAFRRSVATFGYHRQEAWYREGMAACGLDCAGFVFLPVEKSAPHECALYTLEPDAVRKGREANRAALRTLARCIATNTWPGYSAGIQTLTLPPWG
jgi:hypothetical protein